MHSAQDLGLNAEQIRLKARARVQPMCGVIVAAADEIAAGTTNGVIRRGALLWKIDAIPALREALFQPAPLIAVFDAWVLTWQMKEYFEKGPGRDGLGAAHGIAVATCETLETEMAQLAASMMISGNISDARAFARKWAAEHPIRQSIAGRESTLNRVTEREVAATFSATEVLGNVTTTLDDLNRRLEIYSAQLLDQARWQADLFAMDLAHDYQVDQAKPFVGTAIMAAGRAADALEQIQMEAEHTLAVVDKMPTLIGSEREATLQAISAELTRALAFVQEEREATLNLLTAERIAIGQDLRDTVGQERKALTQDLNQMGTRLVDHAFLRAAQLIGAALALAFIGMVLLLLLTRRLFPGGRTPG